MKLFFNLISILGFSLGISCGLSAQTPDTVDVPTMVNGNAFGAINKFIIGDTMPSGERINPNRVYRLKKNSIYFLDGIFFADFDLNLIGEIAGDGEKPPIIASTAGADGTIQLIQFKLFGNAIIKDIICQMTPPSGNGESNAAFFLSGQKKNYYFDNVRIEWGLWTGITTEVPVNKVVITNCYFRNVEHKTDIWNGRGMNTYQQNPADTVIMRNNTFFNLNSFVFAADVSAIPPRYLIFDHNTIVNSMKFPIHSFWLPNATVTNNIFYNSHSFGENSSDVVGQDPQKLLYGIINIDKIPNALLKYYGIAESERRYKVTNNAFFYEQPIKDYWSTFSLPENPFMNSRNLTMFGDDATYPGLTVENTIEENPNFVQAGTGMTSMITWMTNRRNLKDNNYWGWDPDNNKFQVQWPFPEDLSFTNESMKTAASGGFPLGDLNWWKDKKSEWEDWLATDTKNVDNHILEGFTVSPSPANEQLSLKFRMKQSSAIQIDIFDSSLKIMGSQQGPQLSEGNQNIQLNLHEYGVTSAGVYFIVLRTKTEMLTQRFIKI